MNSDLAIRDTADDLVELVAFGAAAALTSVIRQWMTSPRLVQVNFRRALFGN